MEIQRAVLYRLVYLLIMIDQIVPMVGVMLGSMTTFVGTALAERAQFRRLMATRWDESKLEVYAQYASSVKDMLRAANRLADASNRGEENLAAMRAELEAADDRRSLVFERLVLLGDPDVTESARNANQLVLEAKSVANGVSSEERRLPGDAIVEALNMLHIAARTDLGIRETVRRRVGLTRP